MTGVAIYLLFSFCYMMICGYVKDSAAYWKVERAAARLFFFFPIWPIGILIAFFVGAWTLFKDFWDTAEFRKTNR